jgi:HlyD family secretion protein
VKKYTFFALIMLLVVACSSENDDNNNNRGQRGGGYTPTVEIIQTLTGALPLEERLTGVVRARNQVDIFPEITAPVTEILVRSGDKVDKDQVLVRLRDHEARERLRQAESGLEIANAQVRQAEANLNQVNARLSRVETLTIRNLESELEVETLRAQAESAEANLSLVKAQRNQAESILEERRNDLRNTVIRSPITGYVGFRNVEVGQSVNPSTRLFEVGDTDVMEIRVSLTERMLAYIRAGQTVSIASDAIGPEPLRAQLDRISPFLNPVTNSTEAEIVISNPNGLLRSGMFVTIDILYGESDQAVLIPNNALYTHPADGRRGVYIADASGFIELDFENDSDLPEIMGPVDVRFVPVQIVAQGRQVSGIRGINSGDYVVTMGHNLLASGRSSANVRIIEWERMIHLQELQSRDLLQIIRDKLTKRNGADTTGV